jgi:Brp/Blh family beta-carotene 15,15'-monooxygenase
VVPPLLAIGLYFCLWHAPRHIARLVLLDRQAIPGTEQRSLRSAITRFARDAVPTTLAALVLLGVLYVVVPSRPDSLSALLALYLALVAALTLPHTVIVTWMDVRQGVWRR